jgi:hypothetical protein
MAIDHLTFAQLDAPVGAPIPQTADLTSLVSPEDQFFAHPHHADGPLLDLLGFHQNERLIADHRFTLPVWGWFGVWAFPAARANWAVRDLSSGPSDQLHCGDANHATIKLSHPDLGIHRQHVLTDLAGPHHKYKSLYAFGQWHIDGKTHSEVTEDEGGHQGGRDRVVRVRTNLWVEITPSNQRRILR